MPRSFSSIWIHAIWATKHREPILNKNFRLLLFHHMKEVADTKGFYIDILNGVEDHVHCLFSWKPVQNVAGIIKDIKGESARWVNSKGGLDEVFNWQEGYAAFSVSPSNLLPVRRYIYNQETHHLKFSFEQEIKTLESAASPS